MGKVYKTQYTVDHGIANGNQRIQAPTVMPDSNRSM